MYAVQLAYNKFPSLQGCRSHFFEFLGNIIGDEIKDQGQHKQHNSGGKKGMVMTAPEWSFPISAAMLAGIGLTESKMLSGTAAAPRPP